MIRKRVLFCFNFGCFSSFPQYIIQREKIIQYNYTLDKMVEINFTVLLQLNHLPKMPFLKSHLVIQVLI